MLSSRLFYQVFIQPFRGLQHRHCCRSISNISSSTRNRISRSCLANSQLSYLDLVCSVQTSKPVVTKLHRSANSVRKMSSQSQMANESSNLSPNRLVWIDLEMTGLEVEKDTILEIACIVTEGDLTVVAEGPNIVIHQSDEVLKGMGEWCIEHHGQSGLTEAVRQSKISLEEAERQVLNFVSKLTPKGMCPMAGNTIGMDKRFIDKYMPALSNHLHYRSVDVSSVKELCRRWYPEIKLQKPKKKNSHRAVDDIRESIEELKYYRSTIFK